jgi:hypothetical protein
MGEFFKGWRRKAGLVALALACALMALCVRSCMLCDELSFRAFGDRHYVISQSSRLLFGTDRKSTVWGSVRHSVVRIAHMRDTDMPFDDSYLESRWRYKWVGVEWGFYEVKEFKLYGLPKNLYWCRVPYWSLILPMTLLSAWLILAKPRKAKGAP